MERNLDTVSSLYGKEGRKRAKKNIILLKFCMPRLIDEIAWTSIRFNWYLEQDFCKKI